MDADTRFPLIPGGLPCTSDAPRDLRFRVAYCSGPVVLSERQGLSMDLGAPVLSLSVGDIACGGTASASAGRGGSSDWRIEERCVDKVGDRGPAGCGVVRGRELEGRCDDTRTGYGDSWSKTIELIELSRANRGDGDFDDNGVSWGGTLGGYRSAGRARLAIDSRDAPSEVGVGDRGIDGPGRLGTENSA